MPKMYHELTRKQLYMRLQRKKNLPVFIRNMIVERAQEKRKALIRAKRIGDNLNRAWEMFIAPLKMEMRRASVRRSAAIKLNDALRLEFYDAYYKLLSKTLGILRMKQKLGGKYPASYDRATWVDWIPAHVQQAFKEHHAKIYLNFKARTPSPLFMYTDPEFKRNIEKNEIITNWTDDLRLSEGMVAIAVQAGNKEQAKYWRYRKFLIEKASTRLKYLPANKRIFNDWARYLTEDEAVKLEMLSEHK